ncbi:DNA repair protein Rad60 [Periplaneta americana]|uniref:DNA repair protein Rad60 n=1 Tax=Periplaneta americana TaxID=6978 RepID=UPI0037E824FD
MEQEEDVDYASNLYTSAASDYAAIKQSLNIDIASILNEVPDEDCDELLSNNAPKRRRGRKPKAATSNTTTKSDSSKEHNSNTSVNETPKPTGSEETTVGEGCQTRRKTRRESQRRARNGLKSSTKEPDVIGPTIVIDSPTPSHILDSVTLISSDSETEPNVSLNEDDDNYEISVKVWWKFNRFDKFEIRRYQKMTHLFEHYSELEGVPQNQILLMLNDVQIYPHDTPDSLKLTVASVVEGGVMSYVDTKTTSNTEEPALSKDEIELKFQRKGCKEPFALRIRKTNKMRVLMLKCAEHLEVPIEKLKFSFDGESLNANDTPEDLDLEGGECIDLYVCD